jgi:hypothetical protein
MKYQVPQFIEMEEKVIGPLSFKEFIYLAGGAGASYILYRFISSFYVALLFIIPVAGFALALAFYKPNSKPFIEMVQSSLLFVLGNKLFIWKKENKPVPARDLRMTPVRGVTVKVPNVTGSKLSSIGWTLDVKKKADDDILGA